MNFTTIRKHGVRRAAIWIGGATIIASLAIVSTATASTKTFRPAAIRHSTAVFEPHGLNSRAVAGAKIWTTKGSRRLPTRRIRRSVRTGTLRVHVPAIGRAAVGNSVRLLVILKHPQRRQNHQDHHRQGHWERSPNFSPTPPPKKPKGESTKPEEHNPSTEDPSSEPPSGSASTPGATPETSPATPPAEWSASGGEITIPATARYVSSNTGSDSNPGTEGAPWRTIEKAISSARAGDVVVLEPGTYGARGTTTNFSNSGTSAAPITFTGAPGQPRPVLLGYARVVGSHLHLNSIVFEGPTGGVVARTAENPGGEEVQVSIMYGNDVELSDSEVLDNAWHAGVFVSNATNVRIMSNYIHDNGDATTGANLDHGIYWCTGGSGVIANNRIEDNVAWGVHLYPTATNVQVVRNTVVGNRQGGMIVARESANNQLENNVVVNNGGYGIRAYYLTGAGNTATDNVVWGNGQNIAGAGLQFAGTIEANPLTMSAPQLAAYGVE